MSDCSCDENVMCVRCVERQRVAFNILRAAKDSGDNEPLLEASLRLLRQEQTIEDLTHDNTLLRAQVRCLQLRLERRMESTGTLSMLLRPQAG